MRIVLFLLLTVAGLSCSHSNANAQTKTSPDRFEALLAESESVQLIDVRTPEEYRAGHLTNARLINFHSADFTDQLKKLDKNEPVLVYCAVGGRSGKTAAQLTTLGFVKVYDLDGGFNAWKTAGKRIAK